MHIISQVETFFANHPSVGLILPDGWFDRPYDNLLQFTGAEVGSEAFRILFSHNETLALHGDLQTEHSTNAFVIHGFAFLQGYWKQYGTNTWTCKRFESGQVEFVGQPCGVDH